jgi:RHS repeat-associated protein
VKASIIENGPKAYLNYIVFDRDFNYINGGFKRVSDAPKEDGTNVAHERLAFDGTERVVITEPGYIYVYLSNENETPVDVYFDDFRVDHIKGPIVNTQDYYPYGLTFNAYQREDAIGQANQFNGKELQDELDLTWLDYGARMYDPQLGKWHVPDPLAGAFTDWSPYSYAYDNPIRFIDPFGMANEDVTDKDKDKDKSKRGGPRYGGSSGSTPTRQGQNYSNSSSSGFTGVSSSGPVGPGQLGVKHPKGPRPDQGLQGDPKPLSLIEVLHASSRLDIFRETTFYPSPASVTIEANTVYIEYDKSGKIKVMNGFTTTQKVIIYENKSIWGAKDFSELSISPAMKGFIYEVENSVYHCLGCRHEQSGIEKWWDFIWSKPEERKNRLNSGAPHR